MFFEDVTYSIALMYGLLSFFSPCVLPLIPSYFCIITGLSLDELTQSPKAALRRKIMLSTLAFVLGFSIVFTLLGASASYLGGMLGPHKGMIRILGGAVIILFGLHLIGIVRIPWLQYEKRVRLQQKPLHLMGVMLVGMAFGAGWTPCIGPILASLLVMANDKETVGQGMRLLGTYSLGLSLPFILLSAAINYLLIFTKKATRVLRFANPAAGVLLLLTGILLIMDKLSLLSWY
jgi:cytochrome c-type biogenesis protein